MAILPLALTGKNCNTDFKLIMKVCSCSTQVRDAEVNKDELVLQKGWMLQILVLGSSLANSKMDGTEPSAVEEERKII